MYIYIYTHTHYFFHISVAEPEEAGELGDPQSDPQQPADIITRDIFSIILYVDVFRD